MDALRLNKWQRLIVVAGALISAAHAITAYLDEDRLGFSFGLAVALGVLAVTKPVDGEDALPLWGHAKSVSLKHLAIAAAIVAFTAVAVAIGTRSQRQPDYSYPVRNAGEMFQNDAGAARSGVTPPRSTVTPPRVKLEMNTKAKDVTPSVPFNYYDEYKSHRDEPVDPVGEALKKMHQTDATSSESAD